MNKKRTNDDDFFDDVSLMNDDDFKGIEKMKKSKFFRKNTKKNIVVYDDDDFKVSNNDDLYDDITIDYEKKYSFPNEEEIEIDEQPEDEDIYIEDDDDDLSKIEEEYELTNPDEQINYEDISSIEDIINEGIEEDEFVDEVEEENDDYADYSDDDYPESDELEEITKNIDIIEEESEIDDNIPEEIEEDEESKEDETYSSEEEIEINEETEETQLDDDTPNEQEENDESKESEEDEVYSSEEEIEINEEVEETQLDEDEIETNESEENEEEQKEVEDILPVNDNETIEDELEEVTPYNDSIIEVEDYNSEEKQEKKIKEEMDSIDIIFQMDNKDDNSEGELEEVTPYVDASEEDDDYTLESPIKEIVQRPRIIPRNKIKEVPRNYGHDLKYRHSKIPFYIGYTQRIMISIIIVVILLISSIALVYNSFDLKGLNEIRYKEMSNINYDIYLNDNDFYHDDKKYDSYLSSVIQLIKVNMNYTFDVNEKSNINFTHRIAGDLIIVDSENSKNILYKNTYVLSGQEEEKISDSTNFKINKDISIDYWYYNGLSNQFKDTYGVNTESYLLVYLDVEETNDKNNSFKFKNNSQASIKIPLSQNAVRLEVNNINKESEVNNDGSLAINDKTKFFIGLLLCIFAIIVLVKARVDLIPEDNTSAYDRDLDFILKTYDNVIIDTETPPNMEKEIIIVKTFKELLDARKTLNETIKFYEVSKHNKCVFYINHNEEVYVLTKKAVDDEQEKKI